MCGHTVWISPSQGIMLVAGLELCNEEGGSQSSVSIGVFKVSIIWQHHKKEKSENSKKSKLLSYKKGSERADPFRELIRQKFCSDTV